MLLEAIGIISNHTWIPIGVVIQQRPELVVLKPEY